MGNARRVTPDAGPAQAHLQTALSKYFSLSEITGEDYRQAALCKGRIDGQIRTTIQKQCSLSLDFKA